MFDHYTFLGILPTYPSPKPTFCPKWQVSVNVGLKRGRWAVSQKRIFAKGFCLDSRNCSYCFQNQSQSCSPDLRKREPKDTIFAALLWRPESVIPWFHERFVARRPIGQIWDRWWVYEVLLFGKTANKQSNGSWVVDWSITNMKENNFLFLHRTNATASVPQRIFFMLKRRLGHKYSTRHKEKILEWSARLTAKRETEAFKKVCYT